MLDAIDGDSLLLLREGGGQFQARLMGVEAPGTRAEKRHPSKVNLGIVAFGRWGTARCDPAEKPDPKKHAVPKPLLCRVYVDGKDVALAQLDAGQASFSRRFSGSLSEADRETYQAAEQSARDAHKGMWID